MRTWSKLVLSLLLSTVAAAHAATPRPILLTAERVWTGDGPARTGWAVLVAEGRIQAAGPAARLAAAADAERIDLPGATLIPGLMDLHSHVLLHPYNETSWDDQVMKEAPAYRTLLAGKHASATLQAGFTTLRDLGSEGTGYADVMEELKAMVEAAHVTGRKVAVHASSDDAIRMKVLAGADTIEHGYGASEATFRLMAERRVAYVPTLTATEATSEYFQKHVRGGTPTGPMRASWA